MEIPSSSSTMLGSMPRFNLRLELPLSRLIISTRSLVCGPENLRDAFILTPGEDEVRSLVAQIDSKYRLAAIEKVPSHSGYCLCLGLLDPVGNIRVNSFIHAVAAAEAAPPGQGAAANYAKRSVDGLLAFLTCIFPNLPKGEAIRYLIAADADPLVAARLVIKNRGIEKKFLDNSATTLGAVKAALQCAATVAQHPDLQRFMEGWKNLSHGLKEFAKEISCPKASVNAGACVVRLIGTPRPDLQLSEAWDLAKDRLQQCYRIRDEEDLLPVHCVHLRLPNAMSAKKRILLATIHRYYLKALGSLPQIELREYLHYSMLKGGYCYGPLDPVSNIIINTIWYDKSFPRSTVKLEMLSTKSLWRAAARSLYALISFLCTRYPFVPPEEALNLLLDAGGNLIAVDPSFVGKSAQDTMKLQFGSGKPVHRRRNILEGAVPSSTVTEAYAAAAKAAFHPYPVSHIKFLGSTNTLANLETASRVMRLHDGRLLSSKDLEIIGMHIFECPSSASFPHKQPEPEPKEVNMVLYTYVSERRHLFWSQHARASEMVAAALAKFNKTKFKDTMELHYKLHVICGVNEYVSHPDFCGAEYGSYDPCARNKYLHSHINFLATREGEHTTLFFAECENPYTGFFTEYENDGTGSWCVPVSLPQRNAEENAGVNPDAATDPYAEQVRCIYCECSENRIVHPAVSSFHGRNNFVELFHTNKFLRCSFSNNEDLVRGVVDWVNDLEDDSIYINYLPGKLDPKDANLLRCRFY